MDHKFNFSRDFSEKLAIRLLQRLEKGARTEELEETASAASGSVWGWGRFLMCPETSLQGQIGTFATCDALRSIDRIQAISKGYHSGSRAVPSARLQAIYLKAQKLMLVRCTEFMEGIQHSEGKVSSPRLAALLSTIARTTTPDDVLVTSVIGRLQKSAIPSADYPDSIAWSWYLSGSTDERYAEVGPTALLLGALLSIEPLLRSANSPALDNAVSLIDSSANYLCSTFESKYQVGIEELVVSMSALRVYGERAVPTLELLRRRAAIVNARQQILAEEFFEAFASHVGFSVVTLKSRARNKVLPQDNDATYDIFLHGPLISAFFASSNPRHHEVASAALRQALTALAASTNIDEPISTHWLASVIDALPTSADILLLLEKKQPYAPFRRFVTVPDNRVTFLILSDTQFGLDSTANRSPLGRRDSFDEVKAGTFEQLTQDAATKLLDSQLAVSAWSGLLHLGDVVCRGDFEAQENNAVSALRDSIAILGVPTKSFVVCPGNHDLTRSSLIGNLPRILGRNSERGDFISFRRDLITAFRRLVGRMRPTDHIAIGQDLIAALREESSYPVLAQPGFGCFRDMYSRLVEQHIFVSDGGVEVVSFLAPRIRVHVVSLWPLVRHRITTGPKGERNEQYGLASRAQNNVRDFLKTVNPSDIVILLCHVPPEHLNSWSDKDSDRAEWLGPSIAKDMRSFIDFVLDKASVEDTQPAIHLIMSGHMQEPPALRQYRSVWSYTAGAFHIHSDVSRGTFAARLSIDEGALRIDNVGLDARSITTPEPTIIAIGNDRIGSESYDAHVINTYDAEAEQFTKATNVAGKYVELENVRKRFGSLVSEHFVGGRKRVLDVGAGAGRDSNFFLEQGFCVDAVEGAPRLAAALRERFISKALSVHEVNIVKPGALQSALNDLHFHGIWVCASLLHIPSKADLVTGGTLMDSDIIKILSKHLVPGGILYVDNKLGIGAHYKERGNVFQKRWFRYRRAEELEHLALEAGLNRIDSDWYNGTNGFDAWIWLLAEKSR